jgi:hypothetical protein
MSQDIRVSGYTDSPEYPGFINNKSPKKKNQNLDLQINPDIRISDTTGVEEEEIEVEIKGQWGTKIDALLRDLKLLLVKGRFYFIYMYTYMHICIYIMYIYKYIHI